jgi:hypothetical protein
MNLFAISSCQHCVSLVAAEARKVHLGRDPDRAMPEGARLERTSNLLETHFVTAFALTLARRQLVAMSSPKIARIT